jgi:hypothetical protein
MDYPSFFNIIETEHQAGLHNGRAFKRDITTGKNVTI